MEESSWITTKEAADLLGVSTARIRQLVAANALTAQKLGGKYRGQWLVSTADIIQRLSNSNKGEVRPMRVKNRMTRAPITVQPKTSYNEALRLMEQNNIHHLPVLNKKGDLVGIVTQHDMLEAEPSRVSTLSIFEIASLLDKVTMDQIMNRPVKAIQGDCSISEAAHFMLEEDVGCLPVMEEGKMVGIITDNDIFKTFVEVTGGGESGTRIEAKLPNVMGQLAAFTKAVTESGGWIVSLALTYDDSGDFFFIDMKERGGDEAKLKEELEKMGSVEYVRFSPCSSDQLLEIG
ncbi:MAG: CBS domain-containing protein [Anaerolineales bacterium]